MSTFSNESQVAAPQSTGLVEKGKSIIIPTLLIIILGGIAQTFLPWWTIAVVAFCVGYFFSDSWGKSFAYGFIAVTLLWAIYAAILDSANGGAISSSISGLFGGAIKSTQLIYVTGIIGGLVGGFAAATGTAFRFLINDFRKP